MNSKKQLTTGQVARLLGVKIHQLQYAFVTGGLTDVPRFGDKRAYGIEEVRRIAEHLDVDIDDDEISAAFEKGGDHV